MLNFDSQLLLDYQNYLSNNGIDVSQINGLSQYSPNDIRTSFIFFQNQVLINKGELIIPPPIEVHPYITNHPVDISRRKLIIGTFPPISYIGDYIISEGFSFGSVNRPKVSFFHGNELSLWNFCADDLLAQTLTQLSSGKITRDQASTDLNKYLLRNSLDITDIICFCQRQLVNGQYTAKDKFLCNIELNLSLIELLINENEIKELIFTNSGANGVKGIKIRTNGGDVSNPPGSVSIIERDALSLFLRGCQMLNKRTELMLPPSLSNPDGFPWTTINFENATKINNLFTNKMRFNLRIFNQENSFKEFIINTPPSPSGEARRGLANNAIYKKWALKNNSRSVDKYRRYVYQAICNGTNHSALNELNL